MKIFSSKPFAWFIYPTLAGVAATLITDGIKGVSILTTFESVLKWLYNITVSFLTFTIPIYVILIAIGLCLTILHFKKKKDKRKEEEERQKQEVQQPAMLSYREAKPKNFKWTWDYLLNTSGGYEFCSLKAHCGKCDTHLRFEYSGYNSLLGANCPRCRKSYSSPKTDNIEDIKHIILDNIRRINSGEAPL